MPIVYAISGSQGYQISKFNLITITFDTTLMDGKWLYTLDSMHILVREVNIVVIPITEIAWKHEHKRLNRKSIK